MHDDLPFVDDRPATARGLRAIVDVTTVVPAATGTDGLPAVPVPLAPPPEITEIDIQRAGCGVL